MKKLLLFLALLLLPIQVWAATITFGAVAGNWSDPTKWVGGAKPVAGDDVLLTVASANCAVNEATAELNSFNCTGYTGTLSGSSNITVTVASGTSTVLFAGTSPTWSGILLLNPAAGTTINLTMGSLTTAGTIGGITIAGTTTGAVYFLDAVTMASNKTLTLTSGTLHTDGATDDAGLAHSIGRFITAVGTKTAYLGNSTITLTLGGTAWNWSKTNATLEEGTSTLIFSGNNSLLVFSGPETLYSVQMTGTGSAFFQITLGGALTCTNFSRTHVGAKTDSLRLDFSSLVVTGALTITGNSATNRILVNTDAVGTTRTLTCSGATVSVDNVDFRDIRFARADAGALDLTNGGANLIGDCGGNSKTLGDSSVLTMTTSRVCNFKTAAGGNWADANWDTAVDADRVPLPQDDVTFATAFDSGVTITGNMLRLGRDIDFSGATATGAGVLPVLALSNVVSSFGSVDLTGLKSGGLSGAIQNWTFESQARTGVISLVSNGQTFVRGMYFSTAGSAILSLADAISCSFLVVCTSTNSIRLNSYTHTLSHSGANGSVWTGAGTIDAGTSTLVISSTAANNRTFTGGSKTYYNLSITGGGTGVLTFTGSNTFNNFTINAPKTVNFTAGTTTTINGKFTAIGTPTDAISLASETPSSVAYLKLLGGQDVRLVTATDLDSSTGYRVYDVGGVITRCVNWFRSRDDGMDKPGLWRYR